MISIKANISDGEVILFQVNKKKWIIPLMLTFCSLWMLLALVFIVPCFENMFLGVVSFDSKTTYIISIIMMLCFVPLAVLTPISFLVNKFVISDQRIYIRKGLSGILHIINYGDILAYQYIYQNIKGISSHFIHIYLKSGKRISSGNLYIKEKSLTEFIKVLNSKIENTISSRKQYKELKQKKLEYCNIETRRNRLLPVLSLSPFIIALIMSVLYFVGANKVGEQIDINVYGRVESKSIDYDDGEISGYDFIIIEDGTNKQYDLPINENIYSMFEEGDKLLIKAKKGTLGIVYDQWVYTQ